MNEPSSGIAKKYAFAFLPETTVLVDMMVLTIRNAAMMLAPEDPARQHAVRVSLFVALLANHLSQSNKPGPLSLCLAELEEKLDLEEAALIEATRFLREAASLESSEP